MLTLDLKKQKRGHVYFQAAYLRVEANDEVIHCISEIYLQMRKATNRYS